MQQSKATKLQSQHDWRVWTVKIEYYKKFYQINRTDNLTWIFFEVNFIVSISVMICRVWIVEGTKRKIIWKVEKMTMKIKENSPRELQMKINTLRRTKWEQIGTRLASWVLIKLTRWKLILLKREIKWRLYEKLILPIFT